MRRTGGLFDRMTTFDAICKAARRAALGKRRRHDAARFLERLEPEALALERELRAGTWRPSPAVTFEIRDPKPRTITAVPFCDRVVHHALMGVLAPVFERRMVYESFACREGKGTHAALRHAQRMLRGRGFFLKLDIRGFFPSLRHAVVLDSIGRVVKDGAILELCARIVAARPDPGVPIGSLTSQWFANLVLDRLDHHVKERLRVPGYVRYMDDFVLFDDRRDALRAAKDAVAEFLGERLHLQIKDRATLLAPARSGLPFLGFQVLRGTIRLRQENARRAWSRLKRRAWQVRHGLVELDPALASIRSITAHLEHGRTRALRRAWFAALFEFTE